MPPVTVTAGFSPSASGGVLLSSGAAGVSPAGASGRAASAGLSSSLFFFLLLDRPSASPARPTRPRIQPYSWYQACGSSPLLSLSPLDASPVSRPSTAPADRSPVPSPAAASPALPSSSVAPCALPTLSDEVGSDTGTCKASVASLSAVLSISTLVNRSAPDNCWSRNCNVGDGRSRILTASPGNSNRVPSRIRATRSTPTIAMLWTSASFRFNEMVPFLMVTGMVLSAFFIEKSRQVEEWPRGTAAPVCRNQRSPSDCCNPLVMGLARYCSTVRSRALMSTLAVMPGRSRICSAEWCLNSASRIRMRTR